jgi:hypothetical protein
VSDPIYEDAPSDFSNPLNPLELLSWTQLRVDARRAPRAQSGQLTPLSTSLSVLALREVCCPTRTRGAP